MQYFDFAQVLTYPVVEGGPTECKNRTLKERIRQELSKVVNDEAHDKSKLVTSSSVGENKNFFFGKARLNMTDMSKSDGEKVFQGCGVDACYRCGQAVFPLEKIEPRAGEKYHPRCFICAVCGIELNLANFCRSLQSPRDSLIYCRAHQPHQSKAMLCNFSTRRSNFPAFKLSWLPQNPEPNSSSIACNGRNA